MALNQEKYRSLLKPLLLIDNKSKEDISEIIDVISESGGISLAKRAAIQYVNKAQAHLDNLEENQSKSSFQNLINFVIVRNE